MISDLTKLNINQRAPDAVLALDQGVSITWQKWFTDVLALRTRLASEPLGCWPVYFQDAYPASVALFALWSTERMPLMLPDTASHTIAGIDPNLSLGGYLADQELPFDNPISVIEEQVGPVDAAESDITLNCQVMLLTSGSTGTPLVVSKTHRQLISEVILYVRSWHNQNIDETFAATVSHQHIYGLIFRLLMPIAAGQPFVSEMLNNPRQLLGRYGKRNLVWVASPAQLKRISGEILQDLPLTAIGRIYSSGGLLEEEPAAVVRDVFDNPAVEVYGSTETGGMAWRQQMAQQKNPWQLLEGVDARVNGAGLLEVCSAFTENRWVTTGDKVALAEDGSFSLLGRADKIVKLEEKRVSLTALEMTLARAKEIAEVRVFLLEGTRQQMAAVIVLSEQGVDVLLGKGRKELIEQFKSRVGASHPAHEVPRRYRFVGELPQNAQGKVTVAALAQEFQSNKRDVLPVVQSVAVSSNNLSADVNSANNARPQMEVVLGLLVPPDLDYFSGHFSQYPVLPGVVQLLWVRHFARLHLGISGDVQKMTQVKFKSMILPGEALTMQLRWNAAKSQLSYKLETDKVCASGNMWASTDE